MDQLAVDDRGEANDKLKVLKCLEMAVLGWISFIMVRMVQAQRGNGGCGRDSSVVLGEG